jgi:hypothetical protein
LFWLWVNENLPVRTPGFSLNKKISGYAWWTMNQKYFFWVKIPKNIFFYSIFFFYARTISKKNILMNNWFSKIIFFESLCKKKKIDAHFHQSFFFIFTKKNFLVIIFQKTLFLVKFSTNMLKKTKSHNEHDHFTTTV